MGELPIRVGVQEVLSIPVGLPVPLPRGNWMGTTGAVGHNKGEHNKMTVERE